MHNCLFHIETDRVSLNWALPRRGLFDSAFSGPQAPPGRLQILPRRTGVVFTDKTWRSGVPAEVASDWRQVAGPRLFEQSDYSIMVVSKVDLPVALLYRDPTLVPDLHTFHDFKALHGSVNFGPQVGLSEFSVLIGSEPEFDFRVEIFPTKIDYQSDFEQLTAEVQEILTGLVLEYLRATFRMGEHSKVSRPSRLEWTILLKHVMDDLERAITYITQHPQRTLQRQPEEVRSERIKRVDASVRRAISRGLGAGQSRQAENDLILRERMAERTAQNTLNTPEHRWMAHQIQWIRHRLGQISRQMSETALEYEPSPRLLRIQSEILLLEQRAARLAQAAPLQQAQGSPPTNFASLKLLGAPGYSEAYRAIQALSRGLRLTGGPVDMSLKDVATLYEYWCYLAVVRICCDIAGKPLAPHHLIRTEQNGLRVLLQKGVETSIPVDLGAGRKVDVVYNRRFQGKENYLVAQQPDIVLTIHDSSWPIVHLVVDAKYRISGSAEIRAQYGSPGPPADAINVLHRYRDAIVELENAELEKAELQKTELEKAARTRPRRTVVEAVTLFPYREEAPDAFRASEYWKALDRIGIGAIPFLPESTRYFEEYLEQALTKGGWSLSDRAITHRSREHALSWRIAASTIVLIGVLRANDEDAHIRWIKKERTYYMPMLQDQQRQYEARWLTLYSPAALRPPGTPGAVTHIAQVKKTTVLTRKQIETPWAPRRGLDEQQVVYTLGPVEELDRPIENLSDGRGARFSRHRWTSLLAMKRARTIDELVLETEPEWRLYEDLRAARIDFDVEADRPEVQPSDDPQGRAWFKAANTSIQYRGGAGFLVRQGMDEDYIASPSDIVTLITGPKRQ